MYLWLVWLSCREGVEQRVQSVVSGKVGFHSQQASSKHAFPISVASRPQRRRELLEQRTGAKSEQWALQSVEATETLWI